MVAGKGAALPKDECWLNLSPEHWLLATTNGFLGECLMLLNQPETGKRLLLESYSSLREKLGENHMQTGLAATRIEKFIRRAI